MKKRDQDREIGRRALIKWSIAAGAALGVSRARICEILEKTSSKGVAMAAAANHNKRSVHIRAGNGGLAWFQLMWPHNAIAAAHNTAFAWHRIGSESMATGTTKPLTLGPDTPFFAFPGNKQISAYMAGTNEQHTDNANSIVRSLSTGSLFAIASVLQADTPSVVPVITVDDSDFGSAPGAAQPSNVPTADDIVGLFNSAASRAGGLLQTTQHADLYRSQYATLAALNRASTLSTTRDSYKTSRSAARFLGTNLSAQLQFTEDAAYGLTGTAFNAITNDPGSNKRDQVANLAKGLAAAAKAFKLGLASSIVLPSIRDDPHGAFGSAATLSAESTAIVGTLKTILDAFMADLASKTDSVTGEKLSDGVILTIEGDTPKTPLDTNAWPDATPQMSNWMFVLGGGSLRTGWFGSITPDATPQGGTANGFDPVSGNTLTGNYNGDLQAQAAIAATVYAITRGDIRRTQDFSRQDITGLIVPT